MIDSIEKTASLVYKIGQDELRKGTSKHIYADARSMVWYILHYDYSYSINELAREYKKTPRNIKYMVSKMKFQIKKDPKARADYELILGL